MRFRCLPSARLKALPVGIVYAIWAGAGIVAAAFIGVFAFGERLGTVQMVCMALVLVGAVGLRVRTAKGATA